MKFIPGDTIIATCLPDPVMGIRGKWGHVKRVRLDCDRVPLYECWLLELGAWDVVHLREHEIVRDWADSRLD